MYLDFTSLWVQSNLLFRIAGLRNKWTLISETVTCWARVSGNMFCSPSFTSTTSLENEAGCSCTFLSSPLSHWVSFFFLSLVLSCFVLTSPVCLSHRKAQWLNHISESWEERWRTVWGSDGHSLHEDFILWTPNNWNTQAHTHWNTHTTAENNNEDKTFKQS